MTPLLFALLLLQPLECRADAAQHVATAVARGQVFDLAGAASAYSTAAKGCVEAEVPAHYLRGLLAAHAAHAQFGSRESLVPVHEAIAFIDARGGTVPGLPQIASVVLQAAAAAAQSERPTLALYLDQALRLEALQLEAHEPPPLPIVTAHEAAGDLWFLVRDYENARRAYLRAEERLGTTPRITLGLARVAARMNDGMTACRQFGAFTRWWGARTAAEPPELTEARAYLRRPDCGR